MKVTTEENTTGYMTAKQTRDSHWARSPALPVFPEGAGQGAQALSWAPLTKDSLWTKQIFREAATIPGI